MTTHSADDLKGPANSGREDRQKIELVELAKVGGPIVMSVLAFLFSAISFFYNETLTAVNYFDRKYASNTEMANVVDELTSELIRPRKDAIQRSDTDIEIWKDSLKTTTDEEKRTKIKEDIAVASRAIDDNNVEIEKLKALKSLFMLRR